MRTRRVIEVGEEIIESGRIDRSEEYDVTFALLLFEAARELVPRSHNLHNLRDRTCEQRLFTKDKNE